MARIWSSGFELQSVTSGIEWDTTTNSPAIDLSIKRSGLASLRANPTATTSFIHHVFAASDNNNNTFVRFYLYITNSTDALDTIFALRGSLLPADIATIRLNSDRTLELWSSSAVE